MFIDKGAWLQQFACDDTPYPMATREGNPLAQLPPLLIPPPPPPIQDQMLAVQVLQPPGPAPQQRASIGGEHHLIDPTYFKVLTDLQGKSSCVSLLSPQGPWQQLPKEFVDSVWQATKGVPVTEMILKGHSLDSLPHNFLQLHNIAVLDLSFNCFETLPEVLCEQQLQLQCLYMQHNKITSLPLAMSNLVQLKEVHLQHNNLRTLPQGLCRCTSLEILNVDNNQIQTFSEEVGMLNNLKKLQATSNLLQSLPTSINNLNLLEELYVSNNHIRELHTLSGLSSLKQLHLANNELQFLPLCIINLHQLEGLTLTGNSMIFPPLSACRNGVKAIQQYMQDKVNDSVLDCGQGDYICTNLYYTGTDCTPEVAGRESPIEEID